MNHPPEIEAMIAKYPSLKKPIETGIESHDGRERELLSFILSHPDLEQIRGSPLRLLSAIDEFSFTRDFMISIGAHKANIVSNLIATENPSTVVELGGYLGYSAILFAHTMRSEPTANQNLRVWSLELSAECASIARRLIELAGLSDIVTVVVGPAEKSLRDLSNEGKLDGLDLIFLDHVEALYVSDFQVCEELGLLKKGVIVVADNILKPGAPDYRRFVRNHPRLKSNGVRGLIQPGDLEDELEISYIISDEIPQ